MKESWVMEDVLSLKEREIFFMTAEAAGMKIFPHTKDIRTMEPFPHLIFDGHEVFSTRSINPHMADKVILSYKEIMKVLGEVIKEQSNKMWNEHKQERLDNSPETGLSAGGNSTPPG